MPELSLPFLFNAVSLAIALIALWFAVSSRRQAQSERKRSHDFEQELNQQLELVRQSISGLTAGAAGMDRRMRRLEDREKVLSERQETYEIQQADDQPYGQAIRLVQQGAGVRRLTEELDLGEGEAELIVRLHGQRDSA